MPVEASLLTWMDARHIIRSSSSYQFTSRPFLLAVALEEAAGKLGATEGAEDAKSFATSAAFVSVLFKTAADISGGAADVCGGGVMELVLGHTDMMNERAR